MSPSDMARSNSICLEAKKDALSQRQSGDWKVSFTVQGADMDPRLTQAPMGTRYAVVLVEIGDDELPVQKGKMDWREVQPTAQAAIRCEDPLFRAFLREVRNYGVKHEEDVIAAVRNICGVKSRSELSTNHKARVIWKQLDDQFQAWKAKEHA